MPHLVARTKELQLQPRYSPQQMVFVIYKRLLQNVQEHLQVDRRIAESLEVYRKASHRDLCQKITAALPREIRDIIYRHVNTATYTAVGPNRPTEHYRTAAHVGGTIAYEMAESWYRTSLFTVYENDKEAKRCSETGLLFDRDVFGMGFSPEQLVSNLRMVYSIDLAGTNELNLASRMVSRATEHANRLVKKVDLLDILPDRVHLTVVLRATNVFGPASSCKPLLASTFLSRILPILQRQQRIGKAITLRLDDLGDFEFNAEDAVLPPQIWLERIEQVSRAMSLPFNFSELTPKGKNTASTSQYDSAEVREEHGLLGGHVGQGSVARSMVQDPWT
jgi:hypothetical protein